MLHELLSYFSTGISKGNVETYLQRPKKLKLSTLGCYLKRRQIGVTFTSEKIIAFFLIAGGTGDKPSNALDVSGTEISKISRGRKTKRSILFPFIHLSYN